MNNVENMEYNTSRNYLVVKEYGRHIQKMVEYLLTIEDRERRNRNALGVIELMGFLNPQVKTVEDYKHKLWDHLYLISDFKLDVDGPYPMPTPEEYRAKPDPIPYPKRHPKYNHLGKNIEIVIDKALKEEDPEKQQGLANAVAYYMKLTYSNWHKELVHDDNIQSELKSITHGELEFNARPFIKHRVDNSREEFVSNIGKHPRKNFGTRNNRNSQGQGQGRDSRNPGGSHNNNNRKFVKKRY